MPTRVWVRLPVCRRICGYVKARVCACTRMRVACTCMRVCERARALRACMCVCLQVCMCVWVRASCACMRVRVRRCMSVCPRTRMPAWMPALRLCERPSVCPCVCVRVCLYVCLRMCHYSSDALFVELSFPDSLNNVSHRGSPLSPCCCARKAAGYRGSNGLINAQ